MAKKVKVVKNLKAGGLVFFSSYLLLFILALSNLVALFTLFDAEGAITKTLTFLGCFVLGTLCSQALIREKNSVLIHEVKHALISGLAGNKWKGMRVKDNSGDFTFAYSKRSAAYNAFIMIAPYWLPVFTILICGLSVSVWLKDHFWAACFAGLGAGMDFLLNVRDISPIQTDLTNIRGGYRVAVGYIICINIVVLSFLFAWVLKSWGGVQELIAFLFHWLVALAEDSLGKPAANYSLLGKTLDQIAAPL